MQIRGEGEKCPKMGSVIGRIEMFPSQQTNTNCYEITINSEGQKIFPAG
jgi:hypothetical protein